MYMYQSPSMVYLLKTKLGRCHNRNSLRNLCLNKNKQIIKTDTKINNKMFKKLYCSENGL